MQHTIRAVVFEATNVVAVKSLPMPPCAAGHVICNTRYSLISTGTELRTLRGEQRGATFPLVPGYAWVGQVVETAPDVKTLSPGDWVSGRTSAPLDGTAAVYGGHAQAHCAPAAGTLKLPDGCNPWDYVLTEVAAISWRGVSMVCPAPGETALVTGQGLIGALAAKWLLVAGARVIVVDREEQRLERARAWGAWVIGANDPDAREKVMDLSGGGVDIAIEALASLDGVRFAASVLRQPDAALTNLAFRPERGAGAMRYWPRFCLLANYTKTMEMKPTGLLQPGAGALVLYPHDRRVQDRLAVIDQIRQGSLRTAEIVAEPVPADQAPDIYSRLRDAPGQDLTAVFQWP